MSIDLVFQLSEYLPIVQLPFNSILFSITPAPVKLLTRGGRTFPLTCPLQTFQVNGEETGETLAAYSPSPETVFGAAYLAVLPSHRLLHGRSSVRSALEKAFEPGRGEHPRYRLSPACSISKGPLQRLKGLKESRFSARRFGSLWSNIVIIRGRKKQLE